MLSGISFSPLLHQVFLILLFDTKKVGISSKNKKKMVNNIASMNKHHLPLFYQRVTYKYE